MSHKIAPPLIWLLVCLGAMLAIGSMILSAWVRNLCSVEVSQFYLKFSLNGPIPTLPNDHPWRSAWLSDIALRQGRLQDAQNLLGSDESIHADPFKEKILARIYLQAGKTSLAIPLLYNTGDWPELIRVGSKAVAAGNLEQAVEAYHSAWLLSPKDGTIFLAMILARKNDWAAAETTLRDSLNRFPQDGSVHLWKLKLADILSSQKKWAEATGVYQQMLAENPDDAEAHAGLGEVFYDSGGDLALAMQELNTAIGLDPKVTKAYFVLGEIAQADHQFGQAEHWYQLAVNQSPDNPLTWALWGENALRADNFQSAQEILSQAIQRFPDYAYSYYVLAQVYQKTNQPDQAVETADKLTSLAPKENVWYWITAGGIYEWTSQPEKAVEAYRNAAAMDPSNQDAQAGLRRMGLMP